MHEQEPLKFLLACETSFSLVNQSKIAYTAFTQSCTLLFSEVSTFEQHFQKFIGAFSDFRVNASCLSGNLCVHLTPKRIRVNVA